MIGYEQVQELMDDNVIPHILFEVHELRIEVQVAVG